MLLSSGDKKNNTFLFSGDMTEIKTLVSYLYSSNTINIDILLKPLGDRRKYIHIICSVIFK